MEDTVAKVKIAFPVIRGDIMFPGADMVADIVMDRTVDLRHIFGSQWFEPV